MGEGEGSELRCQVRGNPGGGERLGCLLSMVCRAPVRLSCCADGLNRSIMSEREREKNPWPGPRRLSREPHSRVVAVVASEFGALLYVLV